MNHKPVIIANLTEAEAVTAYRFMQDKFGWTGWMFQKDDIVSAWTYMRELNSELRRITDEDIEAMTKSVEWLAQIPTEMDEVGHSITHQLVEQYILNKGNTQ